MIFFRLSASVQKVRNLAGRDAAIGSGVRRALALEIKNRRACVRANSNSMMAVFLYLGNRSMSSGRNIRMHMNSFGVPLYVGSCMFDLFISELLETCGRETKNFIIPNLFISIIGDKSSRKHIHYSLLPHGAQYKKTFSL